MHSLHSALEEAIRFHQAGQLAQAASVYDQIMCQIDQPDVNVLFGYGSVLIAQGQYGLGISLINTGLTIHDKHPLAYANLAVAYNHIGRDDLSLKSYETALVLNPNMPEVLAGLGGFWINKADAKKAESYCRQALAIKPDLPAAHMNLGVSLLEQGRWDEAWPHYEARWQSSDRNSDKRPYKAPRWTGEPVERLSIHGEQGLGDEIMFMSLFREAQKRAKHIVIECAERLVETFHDSFGVPCYATHAELIAACGEPDAYIPMGSLPSVLGVPDGRPYMKRPQHTVTGRPIIGIAWKGGTMKTNNRDRSLNLSDLKPILDAMDADFVSVQYGGEEVETQAKAFGLETGQRDFPSLQHRIGLCDLIITPCQTAVHQAGAMGVDCWVMVPHRVAWRYCGPDMMPWYRSVRFFKQPENKDWKPVIEEIANSLRERYGALAA